MLRTSDEAYIRLVSEKAELEKKVEVLEEFLHKARRAEVKDISLEEIHTLEEQSFYMRGYLRVLNTRLASVHG